MSIGQSKLRDIVVTAIAKEAEVDVDEIHDDLNLFDLGLDSLNLADIMLDIEDGVGAEVPAEVLDRFLDVGEAVTLKHVLNVLSTWEQGSSGGSATYDPVVIHRP